MDTGCDENTQINVLSLLLYLMENGDVTNVILDGMKTSKPNGEAFITQVLTYVEEAHAKSDAATASQTALTPMVSAFEVIK